ncbi:hypothetical protein [Lacisediminimonas profundi]|uniref:hypothetical protein n=1 Tax=Lacisediminimonas profundi TaxID=2603856 RepID=UPI00124B8759|nr:hypothetical protein [Lacisediminimonas profundi]
MTMTTLEEQFGELMTLDDIATLYKCSRRHGRDVITKLVGFPDLAPGSSTFRPRWLTAEVRAFLHRKS